MEGRSQLMIIITCLLALAFLLVCISTGTDNWTTVSETGKDADIIALNINQGLFDRCVVKKSRSRERTTSCYTLNSGKDGYKMQGWEDAVAGLMVTSAIIMGFAVILSGYLMIQKDAKNGIMSDVSPVIIGNAAAVLAVIGLIVYNSKYEDLRKKLVSDPTKPASEEFTDTEVDLGYSFYVGWLSAFIHFFAVFFFFIFKAWLKSKEEDRKRRNRRDKRPILNA